MSPVPDILQVAREAAREDEDGVDPHIIAVAQEARRQRFRGGGDAAEAIVVERQGDVGFGGARLYLDEGDNAATPRHQVDLAAWRAYAAGDYRPSLQPQPERREGLRPPTATPSSEEHTSALQSLMRIS